MKHFLLFSLAGLFMCTASMAQQVENGGFENWETITAISMEEPVDWSSIKTTDAGSLVNNNAPKVWDKSTDAHTGSFSVKLTNLTAFSIVATGTLTNGRVHASLANPLDGFVYADTSDSRWHTVINARPDSLVGWYKAAPQGSDVPTIKAILHNGYAKMPDSVMPAPSWVGFIIYSLPNTTVTTWTRFSIPFTYQSQDVPKYLFLLLNSDDGADPVDGSKVWFDDIELIYNPAGIGENIAENCNIFISNNTIYLQNIEQDILNNAEVEILDISGKLVWRDKVTGNTMALDGSVSVQGIYVVKLITPGNIISRKVFIRQ